MLDLARLQKIKLSRVPLGQLVVGNLLLRANYRLPPRTDVVLEGAEQLRSSGPVFFAMNHTDRYNYWPFQLQLYREGLGYTATWVKGKYYENRLLGAFLDATNNIPLPSRGYVITTEFRRVHGRLPAHAEYRALRDLVDTPRGAAAILPAGGGAAVRVLVGDDPTRFVARFEERFEALAREVVRLNRRALERLGLHLLVFPEGTRSRRLGVGRTGLAQVTQHLGATIVPVGCNGSDRVYRGDLPFARGGRIVYRVGAPLAVDGPELGAHRVPQEVLPFSKGAAAYEPRYRAITEVVMSRLAALLDERHRPRAEDDARERDNSRRFV